MRRRRALPLQLCLLVVGCGYYDSSLLAPAPGAAGSGGGAGGTTQGCAHAFPPDKPAVKNAGGDLDLVFSVKSLTFGGDGDGGTRVVGWDIDKTCTCQGENDSCLEPSWANMKHCDGPEGRDNGFGALISEISGMIPDFGESSWNEKMTRGAWGLMFRIRGYNGLPDDDQVELDWYIPDAYWAIIEGQDGGKPAPKYDGTDVWPIRGFCVNNNDINQSKFVDTKAYISAGVLVGMLPSGVIDSDGWISMVLTDAYLTAKVVQVGSAWELHEGNIAAVWTLEDIFSQLGYLTISGISMCADPKNQIYQAVKSMICKHTDIYRSRGTPTTACDSLSLGIGFDAVPAKLGALTPVTGKTMTCSDAENPANDSCDK
ncbi:MAG: hypothetical protein HY898_36090 [Deltaproteobacteria bacterium]|nr:hypothetical protein [Deltaproteobacteria bacterium]